jgi:hypothetical protein
VKCLLIPAFIGLMFKVLAMCTPPNDDGGHIRLPASTSTPAQAVEPADDSNADDGGAPVSVPPSPALKAAPESAPERPADKGAEVARPYVRPRASGVA